MIITKWLKNRKAENKASTIKRGYDYTAGALLRGEESPMSIESYYSDNEMSPFDIGADKAIDKLVSLKVVIDNRI